MADDADMGEQNKTDAGTKARKLLLGFWPAIIGVAVSAGVLAAIVSYGDAPVPAGSSGAVESGGEAVAEVRASSTVSSPTTVASSWTQSPVVVPPAPAASLSPSAEALATSAGEELGIQIVTEGQDWGADAAKQEENVGAVISAWQRLPLRVTSSVVEHPHGVLQILSNQQGRTSGGWQPYGDVTTSFYTNSDQGAEGYHASNQIVLATGSSEETVLHELLHAYALRNVGADEYVSAFLGDEMRSFMDASGWRLLVSEDTLLANAHEPWDVVNGLFAYGGSASSGSNPLEAFASAGAHFYTYGDSASHRPEFAWFEANLG